jgi:hypothetical protein
MTDRKKMTGQQRRYYFFGCCRASEHVAAGIRYPRERIEATSEGEAPWHTQRLQAFVDGYEDYMEGDFD